MREITYKETLSLIERLNKLTEQKYRETNNSRLLALYDLSRKMRACMNAILLLPYLEFDVLCVPINLLYRCMITDLMTSLLIAVIDDSTFDKVMHIMDVDYTKSLLTAMNTEIEGKKKLYPKDASSFDKMALDYQMRHYDDFKECLKSKKDEAWIVLPKEKLIINDEIFNGTIDSIYRIMLTYCEIRDYANIYKYYRIFSQSEHFSQKNRVFIYKHNFHEEYYNKTRGFMLLGTDYLIKKFSN